MNASVSVIATDHSRRTYMNAVHHKYIYRQKKCLLIDQSRARSARTITDDDESKLNLYISLPINVLFLSS